MSHNGEVIGIDDDDDDDNVSGDDQQILFIGDEEHKIPRRRHPTSGQQQPLLGPKPQRCSLVSRLGFPTDQYSGLLEHRVLFTLTLKGMQFA